MQTYQHEFDRVEDYLHHRPPYLMVERVRAIESHQICTEKTISGQEPFLAGHFPGAPIFPGAMMQEVCTQSAGILIAARHNPMEVYNTHDPHFNEFALGVLVRVKRSRFMGFARPGETLVAHIELQEKVGPMFDFKARLTVDGEVIMRMDFQLTNVPSQTLIGPSA